MKIDYNENGIHSNFEVIDKEKLVLLNMSKRELQDGEIKDDAKKWFAPVQMQMSGFNQNDHHGNKYTGTSPANELSYISHKDSRNEFGRKLEFLLGYEDINVVLHYQFYDDISVVRAFSEVFSNNKTYTLEYLSSFSLAGLAKNSKEKFDERIKLHIPHNAWHGELQWRVNTLTELGLSKVNSFSLKRLSYSAVGSWSSCGYHPMGCIENTDTKEFTMWQIEHNGSWNYEISDICEHIYLNLSGPSYNESHFIKDVEKGDCFQSVPVALAFAESFEECIRELTRYRRVIRRENDDNKKCGVIFNDYMNCLMGDPTSEKLYPLIDAAKEAGCEYFCIDAGWYAEEMGNEMSWWTEVGLWQPSKNRFPEGLDKVLQYIKDKNLIPGLWLELEVMGINCPLAKEWSDDCFFMRNGKRVMDNGRFQLDYRNAFVREYATKVIDRLVNEYGCGYIKMDYNINAGVGTNINSDSAGEGLLAHNRAYLDWLKDIFIQYPDLVIENCGSGGMRMDYAMLSQHSIQSTSDQTEYQDYPKIVVAAATAVTPEQSAVWSYPMTDSDEEQTIFNMVNVLTQRIHQSGHLAKIKPECFMLVKEAISLYNSYKTEIAQSLPLWPNGFPKYTDKWLTYGLEMKDKAVVAVWKLDTDEDEFKISLGQYKSAECVFPKDGCEFRIVENELFVKLTGNFKARLFFLSK
jgi:alpha-galactosidase